MFWEKQYRGKFRRWGKLKRHKPTQKKKKMRLHMNTNIFSFNKCKLDTM